MKKILFLSSVDFKEKSIQVIRKTPEAYVKAGWDVHYVVGRDESRVGDYFYEKVINPAGVSVYRFRIPFTKLSGLFNSSLWKAFWFRVRIASLVLGLAYRGAGLLRRNKFDIVYGYEISGVLAARILRALGILKGIPLVTRFQGVLHVKEWLLHGERFRSITNFEAIMALKTKANLVIMTNDGSQGTEVLKKLGSPNRNILFLTNGVDSPLLDHAQESGIKQRYYQEGVHYFVSISRLDAHKRIDRGLRIIEKLVKVFKIENIRYTVVGGGAEEQNIKKLVEDLQLQKYVRLLGAINHSEVSYHLNCSAFLISMYTSSNVGNPLLEAIRLNKPVITLNNGDTEDWVKHKFNGLLYPIDDKRDLQEEDYLMIAADIKNIIQDPALYEELKRNAATVAEQKLWTWQQRMDKEIYEVNSLIGKG